MVKSAVFASGELERSNSHVSSFGGYLVAFNMGVVEVVAGLLSGISPGLIAVSSRACPDRLRIPTLYRGFALSATYTHHGRTSRRGFLFWAAACCCMNEMRHALTWFVGWHALLVQELRTSHVSRATAASLPFRAARRGLIFG